MKKYRLIIKVICIIGLSITLQHKVKAGEIHDAAKEGDLNKVKELLEANPALLETKDGDGNTPLLCACWAPPNNIPHAEVANYLIDKGANIHAKNSWGGTPLFLSTQDYELSKRLVTLGADVNVTVFGSTPLGQAISIGNIKLTKLFIDNGAEINARSENGTILHRIIIEKSDSCIEIAKLLVEGGIILQEFSFGNNELHLAAIRGMTELVPILVNGGNDVDAVNDYGHTPLYYAARHGYSETADALITVGADTSTIFEKNYGKARQLGATLGNGEAYIWYLGGSSPGTGYAIKTKNHLLVFDPPDIDESSGSGLANGYLNPIELEGQQITFLLTLRKNYGSQWHVPPVPVIAEHFPDADYVVSFDPTADSGNINDLPPYYLATANESFTMDEMQVHTIRVSCYHYLSEPLNNNYGLGYLVEADEVKVFQAGLHSSNNNSTLIANFKKEIDFLKPYGPIDFAILPIKGTHLDVAYQHYLYLIDQLKPKAIFLIGDNLDTEEHKKCIEALKSSNIPVYYPEGGIALGERFHYVQDTISTSSHKYPEKNLLEEKLKIIPNPAQNTLQIEHPELSQKEVCYKIIDLGGKTLLQGKLTGNTIDVSKFKKDAYFLNLYLEGERFSKKIVIE